MYQTGKWLKPHYNLSSPSPSSDSFSQASTIIGEVIRMIPTRTSMINPRVAPFGHNVVKELDFVWQ